jgi:hypothetical protein
MWPATSPPSSRCRRPPAHRRHLIGTQGPDTAPADDAFRPSNGRQRAPAALAFTRARRSAADGSAGKHVTTVRPRPGVQAWRYKPPERTHHFAIDGWRRPEETALRTALPRRLLTPKRTKDQTLSRPLSIGPARAGFPPGLLHQESATRSSGSNRDDRRADRALPAQPIRSSAEQPPTSAGAQAAVSRAEPNIAQT